MGIKGEEKEQHLGHRDQEIHHWVTAERKRKDFFHLSHTTSQPSSPISAGNQDGLAVPTTPVEIFPFRQGPNANFLIVIS